MTEDNITLNELARLKVNHAQLTEAYMALRAKYSEAFPGPIPKPGQRKTVESYDVAFFPYPPEWDALQEHISRADAVVDATRKALAFIEDRKVSVSNAFIEAHNILLAALEDYDR